MKLHKNILKGFIGIVLAVVLIFGGTATVFGIQTRSIDSGMGTNIEIVSGGSYIQLAAGKCLRDIPMSSFRAIKTGTMETISNYGVFEWDTAMPINLPLSNLSYTARLKFTPYVGMQFSPCVRDITVNAFAPNSASQINSIVASLSNPAVSQIHLWEAETINSLANSIRYGISAAEKKKLSMATIEHIGLLYNRVNALSETMSLSPSYQGEFSSGGRIPIGSYSIGAQLAGNVGNLTLTQLVPANSSVQLQFRVSPTGMNDVPIILAIALPSTLSKSLSYYVVDGNGNRISVSINNGYAVFAAGTLDGSFRLYKQSSSNNSDKDDGYVSDFWQGVIDDIASADNGDRIRVELDGRTRVPADVMRELKGRRLTLSLRRDNRSTVNIYGKDINRISDSKDYYTISSLASTYSKSSSSSSSKNSSSKNSTSSKNENSSNVSSNEYSSSTSSQILVPPIPAPIYVNVTSSSTSRPASSSKSSSESENDFDDENNTYEPKYDEREEDEESNDTQTQSASQEDESTKVVDAQVVDGGEFAIFVVLAIVLVCAIAGMITFSILKKRSNS